MSTAEGVSWPALPDAGSAATLAILFQLERSQWLSGEEILARQHEQLSKLLRHARRSVPFYRDRLAGLTEEAVSSLGAECWARIPLLRRSEIQQAGEALLSQAIPKGHGGTGEIFTSGSTGAPIRVVQTGLWRHYRAAFTMRDHLWHRPESGGKLAAIRTSKKGDSLYPEGSLNKGWSPRTSALFRTGPGVGLNITSTLEQQVEWLRRHDPDYLLTHPTNVDRLAQHCLERRISLPRLRQVQTIAEVLQPETRALSRAAWGVPVVDLYSTREAGYLALQCPDHEHYHVQAEGVLLEVLDAEGRACGPGEIGRVVITPLHNFAMPLIRYDLGDHAEVGPPCPCGRGLPVLRRILGRTQNMVTLPSGERIWPLLSSNDISDVLAIAPLRRYQFVQKSVDLIQMNLVAVRPLSAAEEDGLKGWVGERFRHPFEVELRYHEEIPLSAAGKFQDFVSEVAG